MHHADFMFHESFIIMLFVEHLHSLSHPHSPLVSCVIVIISLFLVCLKGLVQIQDIYMELEKKNKTDLSILLFPHDHNITQVSVSFSPPSNQLSHVRLGHACKCIHCLY